MLANRSDAGRPEKMELKEDRAQEMAEFGRGLIGGLMAGIAGLGVLALTVEPALQADDSGQSDAAGQAVIEDAALSLPATKIAAEDTGAEAPDVGPPAPPAAGQEGQERPDMITALLGLVPGPDPAAAIAFPVAQHQPVIQPLPSGLSAPVDDADPPQTLASGAFAAAAGSLVTPYLPALPPIDMRPVPAGVGGLQSRLDPGNSGAPATGPVVRDPPEAQQSAISSGQGRMHGPTRVETTSSRSGLRVATGGTVLTGPGRSALMRRGDGVAVVPPPVAQDADRPEGQPLDMATLDAGPLSPQPAARLAALIPGQISPDLAVRRLSDLLRPASVSVQQLSAMAGAGVAMLSEAGGNRAYPAPDLSIPPDYSALFHDESLR